MSVEIPIVNAPNMYADQLILSYNAARLFNMGAGAARDSTNTNDIILSAPVVINFAQTGVNGLDTGTVAANKLYAVYVVGDSTQNNPTCGMFSLNTATIFNPVNPILPFGYDMFRRIGFIRTDGSSNILLGYWSGADNTRLFFYDSPIATAITAGASTSFADVILTTFVPTAAPLRVWIAYDMTPSAAGRIMSLRPFGGTGIPFQATGQVATVHVTGNAFLQTGVDITTNPDSVKIQYDWSAGGGDAVKLSVVGYEYTI